MDEITIRKIKPTDIPGIKRLALTDDECCAQIIVSAKSFESKFHRQHSFVAVHKRTIVGFLYAGLLLETTFIPYFMFVMPPFRKRGIGSKLLDTAEKASGCGSSLIYYHQSLHDFYKQQGYIHGDNLEIAIKELKGGGAV